MEYIYHFNTPLGKMIGAGASDILTGLWFENQKYCLSTVEKEYEERQQPVFIKVEAWLNDYFNANPRSIDFDISPKGTPFRREVWEYIKNIPYGKTCTYKDIAVAIGEKYGVQMSCQAVGAAVGHNPISIIIPCHRVIGTDASLTGYAAGIEIKKYLLDLEKN